MYVNEACDGTRVGEVVGKTVAIVHGRSGTEHRDPDQSNPRGRHEGYR